MTRTFESMRRRRAKAPDPQGSCGATLALVLLAGLGMAQPCACATAAGLPDRARICCRSRQPGGRRDRITAGRTRAAREQGPGDRPAARGHRARRPWAWRAAVPMQWRIYRLPPQTPRSAASGWIARATCCSRSSFRSKPTTRSRPRPMSPRRNYCRRRSSGALPSANWNWRIRNWRCARCAAR